jgi:hypothetical protein
METAENMELNLKMPKAGLFLENSKRGKEEKTLNHTKMESWYG